jgi:hypothetical protein
MRVISSVPLGFLLPGQAASLHRDEGKAEMFRRLMNTGSFILSLEHEPDCPMTTAACHCKARVELRHVVANSLFHEGEVNS